MSKYVVVCWPDSQALMDKEGFEENSYLVNDEKGIEDFGSSAYFVDEEWLSETDHIPTTEEKEKYCNQVYTEIEDNEIDHEEQDFVEPIELSDGKIVKGFYLDEENKTIKLILTDGSNNYLVKDFFSLSIDDRVLVAISLDNDEYDVAEEK